jgi:hypothetical protein
VKTPDRIGVDQNAVVQGLLHDSVLIEIERQEDRTLLLSFLLTDRRKARIAFEGICQPELWATGIVVPTIVSRACLHRSQTELRSCQDYLDDSTAERLIASHNTYFPKGGWALVFEVNYGDPFAVFGFGDPLVREDL